jgi:predicted ATPase
MGSVDLGPRRYIFTGAPGSGKTSVIRELEHDGHVVVHEAATDIISRAQKLGIEKPWEEASFADDIATLQKERQMTTQGELQFFDRAPFCTFALGSYLAQVKNTKFQPTRALSEEIERCLTMKIYQRRVFFFENLGFIEHTAARKISYADAMIFEQTHVEIYQKFDFELIRVPAGPIAQRYEFVTCHSN